MKLGVLTVLFQDRPLDDALEHLVKMGVEAIELGTGAYPGNAHCNPTELLQDSAAIKAYRKNIEDRGLMISGLSCHGNPLSPDQAFAAESDRVFRETVRLAAEMEVGVVNLFSGCPGDSEGSKYPNWVTCAWPPEFLKILEWQWEEKVIPYWQEAGAFAEKAGVKLAFEMHPGFVVYNPETLLRLRQAVGPVIGANYDPSHLFWQGIDAVASIHYLGEAIHHFHAKDTFIDQRNVAVNGVLDTKPYSQMAQRSWTFRTVGYGHDQFTWRAIMSALRMVGYDYVVSIEHEDALASIDEGLSKAVSFLQGVLLKEQPAEMWWA
ncbi:MAG: sugar phosphate isomerase/epimerase [Ardenticatenaceae bacterium]|nr:sugar phosphate isomerase/epimerase [Ardenticatenaceae bacterium]MCB9443434.1 sugar phosphate isomerase/epimerase [Ardenticatenaceae bacterium]